MGSQLRTAVLGAGRWAGQTHMPGLQRDPRCKIVTICDINRGLAQDFADQFGIPEWTSDWQAAISRPGIDDIDVVTSSHTHFELDWAALEAGKHVER